MEVINGKKYVRVDDHGNLIIPEGFELEKQRKKREYSDETRRKMSDAAKARLGPNGKFTKKSSEEK